MKRINRKLVAILLIVVVALGIPIYLLASVDEARAEAFRIAYILANRYGLTVRNNYNYGSLYESQSSYVTTTLYQGSTYYLVASGCNAAYDVDLMVYDENYNLIARDNDSNRVSIVRVTPRWTGTFHLKVHMYSCSSEGAHWVLVYAYN
jgi:hypothetical protein